jgi:hydroxyacylglutathione hydrolase
MLLRLIYNDELAQASYLVGCPATGEALIIDPNRDIEQYIQLAAKHDLRITAVTETHIHADFVSGSRALAQRTGARLYLSDAGPAEWKYSYAAQANAVLLQDGDTFRAGNLLLQAVHTPGHTPEHLSFLLTDTAGADQPMGLFTGDFIFVGDVGRPDLLERAAGVQGTMEPGAHQLFRSLQKVRSLPDYLQIWPAHGAGSACGRALGAVPQTTLGYEKLFNWAFSITDEEAFVAAVLEGQPEPPFYFAEMKRVNKVGPAILEPLTLPASLTVDQLEQRLAQRVRVIDLRPATDYIAGHIAGTINIPFDSSFLSRAGWLISPQQPFVLIADEQGALQAARLLRLIGLENLTGFCAPDMIQSWSRTGRSLQQLSTIDSAGLHEQLAHQQVAVIDVRGASEYATGSIQGSHLLPFGYIEQRPGEIPKDRPIVVMCQTGRRSVVAASVLEANGYTQVSNLLGGIEAWQQAGYPITKPGQHAQNAIATTSA